MAAPELGSYGHVFDLLHQAQRWEDLRRCVCTTRSPACTQGQVPNCCLMKATIVLNAAPSIQHHPYPYAPSECGVNANITLLSTQSWCSRRSKIEDCAASRERRSIDAPTLHPPPIWPLQRAGLVVRAAHRASTTAPSSRRLSAARRRAVEYQTRGSLLRHATRHGARESNQRESGKKPSKHGMRPTYLSERPLTRYLIVDQAPHAARNELRAGAWGATTVLGTRLMPRPGPNVNCPDYLFMDGWVGDESDLFVTASSLSFSYSFSRFTPPVRCATNMECRVRAWAWVARI